MKILFILMACTLLATFNTGCKKKTEPFSKSQTTALEPEKKLTIPGALPEDNEYTSGTVQAAVMEVETKLDIPSLRPPPNAPKEIKKAHQESGFTQTMMVSEDRGKMVFTTDGYYIPKGTELRYNPDHKKYVLSDPQKKQYWAMSGAEIGNLLEGGPMLARQNYTISTQDTEEKAEIAGVQAVLTKAELGFDWTIKSKSEEKKGKVKVKLDIWHSSDAKLKPGWSAMMVDFLTVPFQDSEGQKVVKELKSKVKFPVKWAMEVVEEGNAKPAGEMPPKLVTTARTLTIQEVKKPELASPPGGFNPASVPYEFGDDGQTISPELLGKLPAKMGKPPKHIEDPTEDKDSP